MNQEVKQGTTEKKTERRTPAARPGRAAWVAKNNGRLRLLRASIMGLCAVLLVIGLLLLVLPSFKVGEGKIVVVGINGTELNNEEIKKIIDASGVKAGDEIIGLDLQAVISSVAKACPEFYVQDVSPQLNGIRIRVERRAVLYTGYSGLWFSLDRDLQVLSVSENEEDFSNLLQVRLPDIAGLNVGEKVQFANPDIDRDYIRTMLDLFETLNWTDRVNLLDVAQKFNVSYVIDGCTRVVLGKVSELSAKLEAAKLVLLDRQAQSPYAIVDVSDVGKTIYRPLPSQESLMA